MTISLGNDHAGTEYKKDIQRYLMERGYQVINHGTDSDASVDYPDYIHPVANDVEKGTSEFGIILCGSGNGAAMSANKHQGVRAALCWNKELALLARQHNNANILSIPARYVTHSQVLEMVDVFLETPFVGGRHQKRVEKIPM